MFYIDDINRDKEMTLEQAKRIVMGRARDLNLLEAIQDLEALLLSERDVADVENEIDEFYYNWSYEINAYNKVFGDMAKLFEVA